MGAAAGSGTGCLIKKGKLLPAEAAHSRLGHVGSTSIYSPFSPSQGSGSELPAWQLSCSFPTLTSTILNPFLCPGALSGGGITHTPPPSSTDPCRIAGRLPHLLPFPWLHRHELFRLPARPWVQEAQPGAEFQLAAPRGETTLGEFGSDP